MESRYEHTQRSVLYLLLHAIGIGLMAVAWTQRIVTPGPAVGLLFVGVVFNLLAQCFREMTVKDEGQRLLIIYGPIPLFRKRVAYAEITSVEAGQSAFIDGWGIHYLPGRGWTYNLTGFSCAVLHLGKRIIRIGSDDVDGLVEFLRGATRSRDQEVKE